MFEVIYYSCTGNTRKVAETIGNALGVTPKDIGIAGVVPQDAFIFLGIECFNGVLPGAVKAFIHENRFRGRKIALFTTSTFGSVMERRKMEKELEINGAVIVRNFRCYGEFLDINRGHPTWLELKKAAWFARSTAITLFEQHEEKVEALALAR